MNRTKNEILKATPQIRGGQFRLSKFASQEEVLTFFHQEKTAGRIVIFGNNQEVISSIVPDGMDEEKVIISFESDAVTARRVSLKTAAREIWSQPQSWTPIEPENRTWLIKKKKQERIKVALVGAGGWGRQHARIFAERPDVDFCAIVGRNPEKTQARAEEYGVRAYTDIARMLDQERPDLVSLCLPNMGHFDATLQIIQAGYPLLVEKPLVFDLAEADTLLNEATKRELFFAINFNHRYAVPVQKTREAIEDGRLGDLTFVTWRFGGEGSQGHPYANLIETQCHGFDMLEYLCGPVASVMAEMTDRTGKGFSTLALSLRFANGAVGSLVGSYDSSYAYSDTHLVEINGTRGRTVIEDTVRRWSFQAAGNETAEVWQAGYFNDADRRFHYTFDRHIDVLLKAFKDGAPPPVPATAGRRALQLAVAAIESFETGRRVASL